MKGRCFDCGKIKNLRTDTFQDLTGPRRIKVCWKCYANTYYGTEAGYDDDPTPAWIRKLQRGYKP